MHSWPNQYFSGLCKWATPDPPATKGQQIWATSQGRIFVMWGHVRGKIQDACLIPGIYKNGQKKKKTGIISFSFFACSHNINADYQLKWVKINILGHSTHAVNWTQYLLIFSDITRLTHKVALMRFSLTKITDSKQNQMIHLFFLLSYWYVLNVLILLHMYIFCLLLLNPVTHWRAAVIESVDVIRGFFFRSSNQCITHNKE